jgi:hypothetical protein
MVKLEMARQLTSLHPRLPALLDGCLELVVCPVPRRTCATPRHRAPPYDTRVPPRRAPWTSVSSAARPRVLFRRRRRRAARAALLMSFVLQGDARTRATRRNGYATASWSLSDASTNAEKLWKTTVLHLFGLLD